MSVKKLLILAAAGVASLGFTAAFAGGAEAVCPACPAEPAFNPFLYVEGGGGYAWSPYDKYLHIDGVGDNLTNDHNFWTADGDVGYQFHPNFAIEFAGYYISEGDWKDADFNGNDVGGGNFSSYLLTLGGKVTAPVYKVNGENKVDIFGKLSAGYRDLSSDTDEVDLANGDYWTPVFAAGIDYNINQNFYVAAQYIYVPANDSTSDLDNRAPEVQMGVATLGYKFSPNFI